MDTNNTLRQLRYLAKTFRIRHRSRMNKAELIQAVNARLASMVDRKLAAALVAETNRWF